MINRDFSIYGDREYFECGCAFLVNRKTGEALQSFPCARHKFPNLVGPPPE